MAIRYPPQNEKNNEKTDPGLSTIFICRRRKTKHTLKHKNRVIERSRTAVFYYFTLESERKQRIAGSKEPDLPSRAPFLQGVVGHYTINRLD